MTNTTLILRKIVALKRQKAEQHVRGLQHELARTQAAIRKLSNDLKVLNDPESGLDIQSRSHQQFHVDKLIAEISLQQASLTGMESKLQAGREDLRRVFYSQDQLQRAPSV